MMKNFKEEIVKCDFCEKPADKELCVSLVFPACKSHEELSLEKWREYLDENGSDLTKWK